MGSERIIYVPEAGVNGVDGSASTNLLRNECDDDDDECDDDDDARDGYAMYNGIN